MPRYRYACARCGAFDEMRPLEAYAEPCACPECGAMAPRELAVAGIAGRESSNENAKAPCSVIARAAAAAARPLGQV